MRTVISCDIKQGRASLYLPPDMAELQPESLRYLHSFARVYDMKLVEDRRRITAPSPVENRKTKPPMIAMGLSSLLKQAGVPGSVRTLSNPHRLKTESPYIGITRLIHMAAYSAPNSKQVALRPNKTISNVLEQNTHPINGFACRLMAPDCNTILSHFESPCFRAIGYSAGDQYIMHALLAGGARNNPSLWVPLRTLTRTDFQFQLFPGKTPAKDTGLFYATFYFDMTESPAPWWLNSANDANIETLQTIHKSA